MTKSVPTDVQDQAVVINAAWEKIDPTIKLGPFTLADFKAVLSNAQTIEKDLVSLETQITDVRNKRDAANKTLWDGVKRIRKGANSTFGDDSSEYEMMGGTRSSERKRPARKPKIKKEE
jgi:hypothetical protein